MLTCTIRWNVLVLAILMASAGLLSESPAAGASGGGLTVRLLPATPGDLTAHSSFAMSLAAGESSTGRLVVGNGTRLPMHLAVGGVDALTAQTSGTVYADRAAPRRSDGRWLTPSRRSLRLAPGETAALSVLVRVPAHAVPGDHVAGLAVQDVTPVPVGPGFGVTQVLRSVVGVLVTVPGPARFVPALAGVSLQRVSGTSRFQVVLRLGNAGRRIAAPRLAVTLVRGGHRRTVVRRLDTLLPRTAISFPLPWPQALTRGAYSVTATLQRLRRHYPTVRLGS